MKLKDMQNEAGLSGIIEIKKADGTVIELNLQSKDNSQTSGEKQNGNTSTSEYCSLLWSSSTQHNHCHRGSFNLLLILIIIIIITIVVLLLCNGAAL